MKILALILFLLAGMPSVSKAVISAESVALLYNSAVPESRKLAEIYREARGIPVGNLIGLEMPVVPDISRKDYEKWILKPLRKEFDRRRWWQRQPDAGGVVLPVTNRIRVLVTLRGVPLRIQAQPKSAASNSQNPVLSHDEAAVDSELAMFGVDGLPVDGVLANKFFQSEKSIAEVNLPFLILTSRIDAPTFATCERMIRDAVAVEQTGLWGRAYVDIANKFPQGDQWLEEIVTRDAQVGIPTVVDRYQETLPLNYPMTDAALYYGWYDWNVSGPFLNKRFEFQKGAVAMHLHSFSAEQLSDPSKNWSGALLEKGAAVTIGNVYEPYLHLTHNFSILHQKLLEGYCWVEACWMAMPVASWQGVVLGDPLYRPFLHFEGGGMKRERDIDYRALRAAALEWKNDLPERRKQVAKAAERMKSGILAEASALDLLQQGDSLGAAQWFQTAKENYVKSEDQLRQNLHLISIDRTANRKSLAIRGLRDAQLRYGPIPEAEALKCWLDILEPAPVVVKP